MVEKGNRVLTTVTSRQKKKKKLRFPYDFECRFRIEAGCLKELLSVIFRQNFKNPIPVSSCYQDHEKIHHPGSKDQLEEVWEETDHLDKDDFDPKTFFKLHDSNSDGYLGEATGLTSLINPRWL